MANQINDSHASGIDSYNALAKGVEGGVFPCTSARSVSLRLLRGFMLHDNVHTTLTGYYEERRQSGARAFCSPTTITAWTAMNLR